MGFQRRDGGTGARAALGIEEDVAGLEVPVEDLCGMDVDQGLEELNAGIGGVGLGMLLYVDVCG